MSSTPILDLLILNSVGFLGGGFTTYLLGKQNEGMAMFCISVACMIGFVRLRINMLEKQRLEMEEYISSQDDDEEEDAPEDDEEEEESEAPHEDTPEEGIHADDEASDDKDLGEPEESHYCAEETCGARIAPDAVAGICGGCSLVYYCNRECQKQDWKAGHKLICNPKLPILHLSPIVSDDEDGPVTQPVHVAEPVAEPLPLPVPVAEPEPVAEPVVEPVAEPLPVPQVLPPPLPTVTINGSKVTLPPPPPPPSSRKVPSMGFIV